MNVSCPECATNYRVDPEKVPPGGVRARCSSCDGVIAVGMNAVPPSVAHQSPSEASSDVFGFRRTPPGTGAASVSAPLRRKSAASRDPARPFVPPPLSEVKPPAVSLGSASVEVPAQAPPTPLRATPVSVPAYTPPAKNSSSFEAVPEPVATSAPAAPSASEESAQTPSPAASVPAASASSDSPFPVTSHSTSATPGGKRRATPSLTTPAPGTRRPINPFLSRDPGMRARRLARALVSDMVAYYPAKHAEGLEKGTLKDLFQEEIRKSYDEYVAQVGADLARSTTHFQESLNDVLGAGKKIF